MIKVSKIVASVSGIGYIGKGGGTIAALSACVLWYYMQPPVALQIILTLITALAGVYVGNKVEAEWGKDSSKVVIDEVAGMFLSLLLLPVNFQFVVAGLILFRFFDIAKPLYIRRTEVFPGGWGVMLDDLLAGVYANIVLQLLWYFKVLN
ncbi:MAG: phosphatidylglycerophosphatase A [Bacteroidetes bacterium]|nr:phosphatidylglycerophosphatase A [Bacteroidota bacterium]